MKVRRGWVLEVAGRQVTRVPVRTHGGRWPRGHPIGVVFHYTAGCSGSIGPVLEARGVSAHFCVGREGAIEQYVPLTRVAWHADRANGLYLGIEHTALPGSCDLTDRQLEASAALVGGLVSYVERRWGFSVPLRKVPGPDLVAGFHDHADGDGSTWNLARHTDRLYGWTWARYLREVSRHVPREYAWRGRRYALRRLISRLREALRRAPVGELHQVRVVRAGAGEVRVERVREEEG